MGDLNMFTFKILLCFVLIMIVQDVEPSSTPGSTNKVSTKQGTTNTGPTKKGGTGTTKEGTTNTGPTKKGGTGTTIKDTDAKGNAGGQNWHWKSWQNALIMITAAHIYLHYLSF